MDKAQKIRIKSLDGLRAWAMILVLFAHSTWKFDEKIGTTHEWGNVMNIFYNGWVGVELFFVLSGFLITSQLINRPLTAESYSRFAFRRFFRIAPPYYLAVTLTLLYLSIAPVLYYNEDVDLFDKWLVPVVAHFTFLHDYFGRQPLIDGIFWSIPIEMKFYLILPFLLFFLSQIKNSHNQIFAIIGFYIFYVLCKITYLYTAFGMNALSYGQYFFFVKTPFHFAIDGLVMGVLSAFILNNGTIKEMQDKRSLWNILFYAALCSFFLISLFPYFMGHEAQFFERFTPRILYALTFGVMLVALIKGCSGNRFFELPIFSYLAQISYSVYLLQIFALAVQDAVMWKLSQSIDSGFVCWLISMPALFLFAFGIGHLMFVYVEKPIIIWSKKKWPSR